MLNAIFGKEKEKPVKEKVKRRRGAVGYVPTPEEITHHRGEISQATCAGLIYTTQQRWSNYETGKSRMHPAMWELFRMKIKQ